LSNTRELLRLRNAAYTANAQGIAHVKKDLGTRIPFSLIFLSVLCWCPTLLLSGCGGGSYSPPRDSTPPTAPGGLTAAAISSTQINLSWTASTDNVGVTGYKVERCQGSTCSNFAQIATPSATTLSDTGLTASTSYSYRVRASDAAGNLSAYSNTSIATTSGTSIVVSISPKRAGLTVTQSLVVIATVQNDVGGAGVAWSGGAFTPQNPTTATFTAPNVAGVYTLTATSVVDPSKSSSITVGVTDLAGVTTYHNDLSRDGVNSQEYALTTANVHTATFGKLFSCTVDGAIYAQPLWLANLSVGGARHNVIFVATQHGSVYAFDADTSPCTTLWHVNLLDATHGGTPGETSVPSGPPGNLVGNGFGDITPEASVTSTPVMDRATNTLYVVSKSVVPGSSPLSFFQRLHGLDVTTGLERLHGNLPVTISASVSGTGDGSVGGIVSFDPQNENQRAGLALVNNTVYIAWASHEDKEPYHGWVMGYDETSLIQTGVFNQSPNGRQGGIWMAGGAPAVDASGNLFLITGNGSWDGVNNFGDSLLKLNPSLGLADWFTPKDQATLDTNDSDFGAGGATILVDQPSGPVPHLVIGGGKAGSGNAGELYLLNRDALGHFSNTNANVIQEFPVGGGMYSTPAFWQNTLYVAGQNGPLIAFALNPSTGKFDTASPVRSNPASFAFPGASPSVSSSGAGNGIVWAIDSSNYCTPFSQGCGPALLHAFDATNISATELWNSAQAAGNRDTAGFAVKFSVPTVANGKVYVGTRGNDKGSSATSRPGELDVYGLLPN
jgi:chitodextrinase